MNVMKNHRLATLLCLSIACVYGLTQMGCSTQETASDPTTTTGDHDHADGDHDHDDHDHDDHDHDDHDHEDGDHNHDDHDHGDHDHEAGDHDHGKASDDAHADHDHPAHGIRGGHLIKLSDDKEVEVQFTDDADKFVVHVADAAKPDTVTAVAMSTTIEGKAGGSVYPLKKAETDDGVVYEITSPALATAVKMGDVVKTTLTISTKDGDISGVYKHHAH